MSTTDEARLGGGPVPLWELQPWSEIHGVRAGITGRGSDPTNPFDLGLASPEPTSETLARWRLFGDALGEFPSQVISRQIHGQKILSHSTTPQGWLISGDADGHATDQEGLLLMVSVADCVPIYLVAPRRRAIALLHAGWRGIAAGILVDAIELFGSQWGVTAAEIVMHTGVAISGPEYQVGQEVRDALGLSGLAAPAGLDLRGVLHDQARELGLVKVSSSGHCTSRNNDWFFSHRRSGGQDGRMVAYLGLAPLHE